MMPLDRKNPDISRSSDTASKIKPPIKGRPLLPHLQKILDEELDYTQTSRGPLAFKPVLCKDGKFHMQAKSLMDK